MLLASLKKSSEFSLLPLHIKAEQVGSITKFIFENGEKDLFPFRFGVREVK